MIGTREDRNSREFFLRTRQEAIAAGVIWFVFFVWVIGVSAILGYGAVEPTLVMGVPTWVFWGVLLPFIVATVLNCYFAFFYLKDDDDRL